MDVDFIAKKFIERTTGQETEIIGCSLNSGLGVVLFNLNYALINNDDVLKDDCLDAFEKIYSDSLSNIHQMPLSFLDGFCGIMWTYLNLIKLGIYDSKSEDFSITDQLFIDKIKDAKEQGNYDLFYGFLGYGLYFIERSSIDSECNKYLNQIVDLLEEIAIEDDKGVYWMDSFHKDKGIINMGMAHGIPSIISFLCKVYKSTQYRKALDLAFKAAYWMIDKKGRVENGLSIFPQSIVIDQLNNDIFKHGSRLAWCYGDLPIAVAFLSLNELQRDEKVWATANEIITISTDRTLENDNTGIKDMGICHGVAGIYHLYNKLEKLIENRNLTRSKDYWFNVLTRGLELEYYYAQMYSKDEEYKSDDVGLLCGYSGIGLTLLNTKNDTYNYWGKIFML